MSSPTWDWVDTYQLHTFIAGGRYVRCVANCVELADVYEAVRECVGGELSGIICLNSIALREEDYDFLVDNTNPDVVL